MFIYVLVGFSVIGSGEWEIFSSKLKLWRSGFNLAVRAIDSKNFHSPKEFLLSCRGIVGTIGTRPSGLGMSEPAVEP